ncbi:hypothetical protein FVF58_45390 [Paraburkholderia panacisoli]|uniref:Uncharacterized protein n=1 Tax=Paraburkholderia panacisoli TaxID=2603818 RepID=A0A5B0G469_9BURK|nr:hypothetical protein [Paraburkholderia panacisoli]KAA0998227.1 hypothetical protein FVF58_45390 [Paraburkholderia panacisoli]
MIALQIGYRARNAGVVGNIRVELRPRSQAAYYASLGLNASRLADLDSRGYMGAVTDINGSVMMYDGLRKLL